ncbi:MAG: response regulator [Propionibacteriaceae bacterium]|nr:response regulator [Propionibacteriaceae bacterium]
MSEKSIARVLLYSHDRNVREQVKLALGKRIATDLPQLEVIETATAPALLQHLEVGNIDLVVLDGEATPAGGIGLAYQLKDEIPVCPPTLLLVVRVADAWLATWSKADAVAFYPIDPVQLAKTAADLLRAWFSEAEAESEQTETEQTPADQMETTPS